jgi:2,3-bisphosphoglycerate-dependent phosphoglycerate mutase
MVARPRLILIRHGESQWNFEQRFTGWADVDLTPDGVQQMRTAALALQQEGIEPDLLYSSVLRRCIRSSWELLDALDRMWLPQILDWRLNERHYGALTGRSKPLAEQEFGVAAVLRWRRSYAGQPPALDAAAAAWVKTDQRYDAVPPHALPASESLEQTVERVRRVWQDSIAPALLTAKTVAIVGHGNSLRALIKIIEGLSDTEIASVEVSNGTPYVYELDAALRAQAKHILAVPLRRASEIL